VITVEALPLQSSVQTVGADSAQSAVVGAAYIWKKDNVILANVSRKIRITETGNYTVTVVSANGCLGPESFPTLITVTSLASPLGIQKLTLAPNPASSLLTLNGVEDVSTVLIVDATGRNVMKAETLGATLTLSVQHLPAGSYTVKAVKKNGLALGRFIKE
jgi:Secretion system C-terminal sorting domain